ncbi:MAG: GNAT family N-acetyltransferase [Bacteroidota bacterium]
MPDPYQITHNEKEMHFEIHEGGEVAFLEYRFYKKDIAFMHTLVPDSMEGKGVASALATYAFQYAKEHHKLVMIYCPYVAAFVKRHPEFKEQLDKEYYR